MDSAVTLMNLSPEKLPGGEAEGHYKIGDSYKAGDLSKRVE